MLRPNALPRSSDFVLMSSIVVVGAVTLRVALGQLFGGEGTSFTFGFGGAPDGGVRVPIEHPGCETPDSYWKAGDKTALIPESPPLPQEYYIGLERRALYFYPPILAGARGVTDADVQRIREVVFDELRYNGAQPGFVGKDGSACSDFRYADVDRSPRFNGSLVTNEYPQLAGLSPEERSWVRAHELGHALDEVVRAGSAFNQLPSAERVRLLTELEKLREALQAKGHTVSYHNASEAFANLYASLLLEPDMARQYAPNATRFLGSLVNQHPQLSRILNFR